jgi:plasmid stabilization system protein ParE
MPENKLYRFDPQAWLELEAAGDWYRLQNAEASVRFLAAVYDALEAIASRRNAGPSMYLEPAGSYCTASRFPSFIWTNPL